MNDTRAYTFWNTPLSMLLRGRLGPGKQRDPLAAVNGSTLPDPAKDLIARVVRRTRLWRHEQHQIAEELLAHFGDGLDSGRSIDELIATFGDPAKAAKLMRRAKKRNRPLWWKLLRGTAQALACFILLYAGLIGLFLIGHPSPTVDYTPRINQIATAAPADQRAWPIYSKAWAQSGFVQLQLDFRGKEDREDKPQADARPGDPNWPNVQRFLRDHEDLLKAFREAAAQPYLGLIVGNDRSFSSEDAQLFGFQRSSNRRPAAEAALDPSLAAVLLPHLAPMRKMANILAMDMDDAAVAGDGARLAADYRALLGMAHQCREHPIVVSELVALGIGAVADSHLAWAIRNHPEALESQHVALLHDMATAKGLYVLEPDIDRDMTLDVIQRVYTDSGHGDGRLTMQGLQNLSMFRSVMGNARGASAMPEELAFLIPAAAAGSSRRDAMAYANRYWDLVRQDLSRPAWEQLTKPFASSAYLEALRASPGHDVDRLPLVLTGPKLDRAARVMIAARAVHEALMAGLSMEAYRSRTGHYPDSIASLLPQYLPEAPLDLSTGHPLLYKLKNGKPLLYGRGLDGTDDGGIWIPQRNQRWPDVPGKGDWILYPEPTEPDAQ